MKLLNNYLITGSDTVQPNPRTAHPTLEAAIHQAKTMMTNADFHQSGAIIWAPIKVLMFAEQPIKVLNPDEVLQEKF